MPRLIACFLILLSALAGASPALAHAALVLAEPANGSVMAASPKQLRLHFNEAVTPGAIRLFDAAGRARDEIVVEASGQTVSVTLPDELPRGTQLLSYRVISQDGHPVGGAVTFSVGAVTATAAPPDSAPDLDGLVWLTRVGVYLGLFAGVGGVFFVTWIGETVAAGTALSAALVAALAAGLACAVASLGLQGLDLLGLPPGAMLTAAPWRAGLNTSLGPSLLIAMAAMATGVVALHLASRGIARALAALTLAAVGLSLASSGHAATAPPSWLTRPAVFIHGVGVAYWLGALVPLAAMTFRGGDRLLAALNRFSGLAVAVVGLLVATGLALAIVQLGSLEAINTTAYGRILALKLILVSALVGLAALNRYRLTPAVAADPRDRGALVRSIGGEAVLALGILGLVAGWRFTPPPRTLIPETPLAIHIHTEQAMFQVLVSPGKVGSDSFVLQLMNGDGSPLKAKEATLSLSLPDRGIEAVERNAELGADGFWHVRDVALAVPGRWHLRIDALVTDFRKLTLEDDFDLSPP